MSRSLQGIQTGQELPAQVVGAGAGAGAQILSRGLQPEDMEILIDAEVDDRGLVDHHIGSFNNFLGRGARQIVTDLFTVEKVMLNKRTNPPEDNTEIANIGFKIQFTALHLTRPVYRSYTTGAPQQLTPNMARNHNFTYCAEMSVDAKITATAYPVDGARDPTVRVEEVTNFPIARIPILVGCEMCHTWRLSPSAKRGLQEDDKEAGGYTIIKGGEWVIDMIESRTFNLPHVFRNIGHEKEITRLEFISKPGDAYENSSELIMRYVTNGNIYLTFTSNPDFNLKIPFYVIFRLLGMNTDKEIIDNVVYGYSSREGRDVVSDHMVQVLKKAFHAPDPDFAAVRDETNQARLLAHFATLIMSNDESKTFGRRAADMNAQDVDKRIKYLNTNILKLLDKYVFPHIGAGSDTRHKKLRFLGHLIHKLLLVEMQIVRSTDRDSLRGKRINAAHAYAKAFKKQFNTTIVHALKKKFANQFKSLAFSVVRLADSFKSAIHGPDLEKALIQTITNGSKEITVGNRSMAMRLASEQLHRKNQLNVLSTLRVIRTPSGSVSKQDARSDEMRRVHPSYTGFVCLIQSADTGEQVGMVKQLSLGASLAEASDSALLKETLCADPDVVPLEKIFTEHLYQFHLTKILVNGDWIGCCNDSHALWRRYLELRRGYRWDLKTKTFIQRNSPGIDSRTTIFWDKEANELQFWVDAGRLLRPLMIVRNNGELDPIGQSIFGTKYDPLKDPEPPADGPIPDGCFVQDILISQDDIRKLRRKELDIRQLHARGAIDYVAPEEMENCLIASSLTALRVHQTDPLVQYTHCEVPVALLGIPALTCPYAAHNQAPRITFQTNQVKQTCGWYARNWPFRIDKHAFLQYYCEMPIIETIANKYIYPIGMNAIVACLCYSGYNQEDSLIVNRSAAERGMYKGLHSSFIKVDLEKGERFGKPDWVHTTERNKHMNYSKLDEDGYVRKGTLIEKDDVLVGKSLDVSASSSDAKMYKDTSVAYTYTEGAMVTTVIKKKRNQEDEEFAKVGFSSPRELGIGDKFSSRHGQKGVSGAALLQGDCPFTMSGLSPGLILNPHAIPSRMTIGQPVEGLASKLHAWLGNSGNANIFRKVDPHAIGDELERYGFDRYGVDRMFNGMTGEWIDTEVFITPIYYQRLQKFVIDEVYSISTGPTCVLTRQYLDGKANKGGLRLGEMEKDVIISHGTGHFIMEKFRDDSDGFEIYVCRNCGKMPIVNEEKNIVICNTCEKAGRDPSPVKTRGTWSSKLFVQELNTANVGVEFGVEPFQIEKFH